MNRAMLSFLLVLVAVAILPGQNLPSGVQTDGPPGVVTEAVATDLVVPWALAFAPDGRLFVTERPGRVRVITQNGLLPDPVITLTDVVVRGEAGLHGIAVDPEFATNRYLYIYQSYRSGVSIRNKVVRLIEQDNRATIDRVILNNIPGGNIHDGGRIKFGPDGYLYIGTGDAGTASRAQDLQSLGGKILRMDRDGVGAPDNPFPDEAPLIYSYGNRNVQGLAFDAFGQLYNTEHGPSGEFGQRANDEVNIIFAGGNYGWPNCIGICGDPDYIDPIRLFVPQAVPPGGATFYNGTQLPQWTGDFFFGTMGFPGSTAARHLHRIRFDPDDGTTIVAEENLFWHQFGRIRDAVEGPDGFLYFTTSNRDGRGGDVLDPSDDRVIRVRPE